MNHDDLNDLVELLRSKEFPPRMMAVMRLGGMGLEGLPTVLHLICSADESLRTRFWATVALKQLGSADREMTRCSLESALPDSDIALSVAIMQSLGVFGNDASVRVIEPYLYDDSVNSSAWDEEDYRIRDVAATSLQAIDTPEAR